MGSVNVENLLLGTDWEDFISSLVEVVGWVTYHLWRTNIYHATNSFPFPHEKKSMYRSTNEMAVWKRKCTTEIGKVGVSRHG